VRGEEEGGGQGILFTVFLSLVKIISLFVNLKEFQATGHLERVETGGGDTRTGRKIHD
jgi:hypothetical protein